MFAAHCGLLAARTEASLPVGLRSLRNLVLVYLKALAA